MKKKTILGIVVALVFSILVGMVFIFMVSKNQGSKKRKETLRQEIKGLKRKLAFSSDPDRNLAKAQAAESKSDWKNALFYYNFLSANLPVEDPRKGYAYFKKAECYYNLDDLARARTTLEFALNHYPDMSQADRALFLMAQIYIKAEEYDNANRTYNTIIRIFPYRAEEAKNLQAQLPAAGLKAQQDAREKKQPGVIPAKP